MTKYPLFGQDSVPQYSSRFFGLIFTAAIWLVLFIVSIFVKPIEKKPSYKPVQIVLEPLENPVISDKTDPEKSDSHLKENSLQDMQEEIPETVQAEILETVIDDVKSENLDIIEQTFIPENQPPQIQEKIPEPKVVEKTPVKTTEKTIEKAPEKSVERVPEKQSENSVQKKTVEQQPEIPVQLSKSVEELMEEQWNKKVSQEFDWDMFDKIDTVNSTSNEQISEQKKVNPVQNSFSGEAGTVETNAQQSLKSETVKNQSTETKTSRETNSSLSKIAETTADNSSRSQKTSGQNTNQISSEKKSENGLSWSNGKSRNLIMPREPKIEFKNQNNINFSEIQISFTVNPNGYVERNSVKTNPPVGSSVLEEIRDQIAEWWFDTSDTSATAAFNLKIEITRS